MNGMRLEIQEDFDKIQCTNQIKEETKQFIDDQMHHKKRWGLKLALSFAVTLLVCGFSYWFYFIPVVTITLDGETSIELQINRLDRVIDVTTYDKLGKEWCKQENPWHQYYEDILQGLNDNEEWMITVYSKDEAVCQKIYEQTKNCTQENKQIHCRIGRHTRQSNDTTQTQNHHKKGHHK